MCVFASCLKMEHHDFWWELILERLAEEDYNQLQAPSVVSKQFHSITNNLRRFYLKKIVFKPPKSHVDARNMDDLVKSIVSFRYMNLKVLVFSYLDQPPAASNLGDLAKAAANVKVLKFIWLGFVADDDLIAIGENFPRIEELEISYRYTHLSRVSDIGVESMSSKLPMLRKINFYGDEHCSDEGLVSLSNNCVLLEEIWFRRCRITGYGVSYVLGHCANLVTLACEKYFGYYGSGQIFVNDHDNAIVCAKWLRELDLFVSVDLDQVLDSLQRAGVALETLILRGSYRANALSSFIYSCPSLKHLGLPLSHILNDHYLMGLCQFLPNLVSVDLGGCQSVTIAGFFILVKECPLLSELELSNIDQKYYWGHELNYEFDTDLLPNYETRVLNFEYNQFLTDEWLGKIGLVCPNLENLNILGCKNLTIEGVKGILKNCPVMKDLTVDKQIQTILIDYNDKGINISCLPFN